MASKWRHYVLSRKAFAVASLATVCSGATAQPVSSPSDAQSPPVVSSAPVPYAVMASSLPSEEVGKLREALREARAGDLTRADLLAADLTSPIARRLVQWASIDAAGTRLDYATLAAAQRDLGGWPRPSRLRGSLEKSLEAAAIAPQQVIQLFQGRDPETPEGAMALASAYQSAGRLNDARTLVEHVWRNHAFGAEDQAKILERFGIYLTPDDHAERLGMLLYGSQTGAAHAMLSLVSPDQRAVAEARMAFRSERSDASARLREIPLAQQNDPGLAFDRAHYLRKHNLESLAAGLVRYFPAATPEQPDVTAEVWAERRALLFAALQSGDFAGAYAAACNHGLQPGADYNEAEFFAGWVALTKLKNPDLAEPHFAKLQADGETPITLSRALYWRGRTAEAKGDALQAKLFWADGAKYYTAFYGQLSAAKIGQPNLNLGVDPAASAADRARFEARDVIRAARMLGDAGERELFTTFVMAAESDTTTAVDLALLVDLTRLYGDQSLAMRIVRAGAQRGLYLPDRGYPVRTAPQGYGLPEPAFVFAITRQESGFDPTARSSANARGMMQLLPGTAAGVARRVGLPYSIERLNEPEYNLRVGANYLAQLVDDFSGSYVLATAAYNAGPGRPRQWVESCGDPRQAGDPADFIECIPFSETRNYVMRVMENMQVYRARLNGGSAPLTLAADLRRGGWSASAQLNATAPLPLGPVSSLPSSTSTGLIRPTQISSSGGTR